MKKSYALELLGGSVATAASAIGISSQAITQWPEELPNRIADRVLAAYARKHLPPDLLAASVQTEAAPAGATAQSTPTQG